MRVEVQSSLGGYLTVNYDIGIQSNCSEATVRINLSGQKDKDILALKTKLELELNDNSYAQDEGHEWDDDKARKEFDWLEAYFTDKTIFGTRVLEIKGDAPYNHAEEIEKVINRYLPKAEREWSEN